MKNLVFLGLFALVVLLTWCGSHNFMDVDNSNAKEDLKNLIWSWNIPQINADDIIPDSLSGVWDTAKWYVNSYYEDTLHEYVDVAKEWISGAVQNLKWYYNSWVEELNWIITDKVNWVISEELDKIKIK